MYVIESDKEPETPPPEQTATMTNTGIDHAIDDAKEANEELFIRDKYGKIFQTLTSFANTGEENSCETSELDLASNLSPNTELEADVKHEEKIIHRSIWLTKTNPIIRYNIPICHE